MRRAVVSTSVGAEGVEYEHGKHLLLADQPHEFAASVTQLLLNPARRTELVENAAAFVHKFYEWDSLRDRAVAVLEREFPQ